MKRILLSLFSGGIGGIAIGFALGIFIYPYWFLNDVADEKLNANVEQTTLSTGTFIQANPDDPVHWGKGKLRLSRDGQSNITVFLEKDFEVGPGPRFHVYLVDNDNIRSAGDFKAAKVFDLGRLRAFKGSQVYQIPANTDISSYGSVVIWCKEFGVLISPATLANAKLSANLPTPIEG